MKHCRRSLLALVVVLAMGCTDAASDNKAGINGASSTTGSTIPENANGPTQPSVVKERAMKLWLHCGLRPIQDGADWYGPVRPESFGNPPEGWDQLEDGTLLLMSDGSAVFRTTDGKEAHFEKLPTKPVIPGCD